MEKKKRNLVLPVILFVAFLAVAIYVYMQKQDTNVDNPIDENAGDGTSGSAGGTFPEGTETQTHEIELSGFAFSPKELTIQVGDTITWTNKDAVAHTVTSDTGQELGSEYLSKGESYSHTFNTEGNFDYHCTPHPSMKGTIIVE